MNVVVRPNGTAELDDRALVDVARDALEAKAWMTLALNVDGDRVGQAIFLPASAQDHPVRNVTAQAMVADLTGAHVRFDGVVVLADLDRDLAHRLLEEL